MLTTPTQHDHIQVEELAQFLQEELLLGDIESEIAFAKRQLTKTSPDDTQDYDLLFQSIVTLQQQLQVRRKQQKPLMPQEI